MTRALTKPGAKNPVSAPVGRLYRALLGLVGALAISSLALTVFCLHQWSNDRRALRAITDRVVVADAAPTQAMEALLGFMETDVGFDRGDAHYLIPGLSFLRPTARQIIEGTGGDCAYRARAYIVLLRLTGVDATKLAVHDGRGDAVHAIVAVKTERGPYLVDVLFGIIHRDAAGLPIAPEELGRDVVLRASIARAVTDGQTRAASYPIGDYPLNDLRSINWEKTAMTRAAYDVLVTVYGEERARRVPRPYLSEEPALMVAFASGSAALLACLLLAWLWRREHAGRTVGGSDR